MTRDIALILAITGGALALFTWNRLRVDVVGIIVMCTLMLTGLVTPAQGISGFANEATATVAAMFVLSAGLVRTGGIDLIGRWLGRVAGNSELRLMVLSMLLVLVASAFVNNTPVVVVMVPVVLGIAQRGGISASRVLMPMSFASQLGGTLTLIGTSTNLLVAGLVIQFGLPRLTLFSFFLPALILAFCGLAYMLTIGRWLTPVRVSAVTIASRYELRDYLSALEVEADSPLVGQSLRESRFATDYGLFVVGIERGPKRINWPTASTVVHSGDVLLVRGKIKDLARIRDVAHLTLAAPTDPGSKDQSKELKELEEGLAEMIVPLRSVVVGRTLRSAGFRTHYGVPVLGIQRHGEALLDHLGDVVLEAGDVLLVQGSAEQLGKLHHSGEVALLGAVNLPAERYVKLPIAASIMLAVVLLAALGVMPILVSSLVGVVLMFLTGCVTPEEAYKEVDWMVLVLLGSLIPLGIAMTDTGTAEYVAGGLLRATLPFGPLVLLFTFYLLTSLLTSAISNNAAVVVVIPIAISTAVAADLSPMPFVIAVMFAASNSFITPIGYQTNTFVFGPGGYRFSDFVRVGGLLNLLLVIVATLVIPVFFPF